MSEASRRYAAWLASLVAEAQLDVAADENEQRRVERLKQRLAAESARLDEKAKRA